MVMAYIDFKTKVKDELLYCQLATVLISFLKSGHHATAARIENTYAKIASSLGFQVDISSIAPKRDTIFYEGFHPASMRLVFALFKYLAYTN